MGESTRALGRVRGRQAGDYPADREDEQFHIDPLGSAENVWSLPEVGDICRHGDTWLGIGIASTALTAAPSTAAHLALGNYEPHTGKTYVIQFVGARLSTTLAAAVNIQLFGQVNITPLASALSHNGTIVCLQGRSVNYRGMGRVQRGATVTADAWHNMGSTLVSANTAENATASIGVKVDGRYVLPPGGVFSLCLSVNTGSVDYIPYIVWSEVQLIKD